MGLHHSPVSILRILLLETPENAWWTSLLFWFLRLITFGLLLRTYLIPSILALVSRHIRVRSVSLRSIRGLYIRKGSRTCRVDRVSYTWRKGINVRVDGLSVDIGKVEKKGPTPRPLGHRRRLTLADFAPSPMASRFRDVLSSCYYLVEPIFRPLIRTCVVACLRVVIRWIPHIISSLAFEFYSTSFTFADLPGAKVSVEQMTFGTQLIFSQLEEVIDIEEKEKMPRPLRMRQLTGMAAWKQRFTDGFQRSLDRAWGKTQGTASAVLKLHNVSGSMHRPESSADGADEMMHFLRLPGAIELEASIGFNPREASADPHSLKTSLNIGGCFLKLDALKLLLKSLERPFKNPPETPISPFPFRTATPRRTTLDQASPESSPTLSPRSSSPPVSDFLSVGRTSSKLPSSPFLEVLSASLRPGRRHLYQPRSRLQEFKNNSLLAVLRQLTITISSITLSTQLTWGDGQYTASIKDIALSSSLCDEPSKNSLYEHCFGRSKITECYDPDTYGFNFSVQKITVDRRTRMDSLGLLTIGRFGLEALATQWPAPWLVTSPFLCGDPNAPLLAIRVKLEGVDFTERLECLRDLVAQLTPSAQQSEKPGSVVQDSYKVPRLLFEAQCGMIRGRIICRDPKESEPTALELRTNGFVASLTSSFGKDRSLTARQKWKLVSNPTQSSLRMDYRLSIVLDSTLVRVRPKSTGIAGNLQHLLSTDADFLHDPSVISMESLEIHGEGHAVGFMAHDSDGVASMLSSSSVLDLHCSTDALCVELWHPNVLEAIHQIFSIVPSPDTGHSKLSSSAPLLDRLPGGISATVALSRLVVFVTAPDVNPLDAMDLSRGVSLHTRLSVHYASIHAAHAHRFQGIQHQTETRHKLYLPQETVVEAIAGARAATITNVRSAHLRVQFTNLSMRSAVATQYDADDPLLAGGEDSSPHPQEFLQITKVGFNASLSGKRGSSPPTDVDSCDISGEIPYIRATFNLAHVYSTLLAVQTVRSLQPVSTTPRSTQQNSTPFLFTLGFSISTIQIMWALPKQALVSRIDGIHINSSTNRTIGLHMSQGVVWACLPSRVNTWDEDDGEKWEELLSLNVWDVSLSPSSGVTSVSVDGDSARIRIPAGYVFADLVLDATVTAKALRHLIRVTTAGHYTDMPSPEPEGPKTIPNISLRIRCLCLEASDDPLESNLAIIWRCGLDAAKHRKEREEAFAAKVSAIYEAESESVYVKAAGSQDQDYQFDAKHSISIEEARKRLDEVHALDWTLRLQNHKEKLSKAEEAINQRLRGTTVKKTGASIPNLVNVTPAAQLPPLFRAMFNGLSLTAQPPSFPAERLSDFLHEQGSGLPRDTEFSLLVPMHLNFTLSSLHLSLRDYPLPLFSISPHRDSSIAVLEFDTDLVIAEEMGTNLSVDWVDCPVLETHHGAYDSSPLSISVPKTIMPVKSYANPSLYITANAATIVSWGVSYTPAIQDLMRVIETLSSSPRDSSPAIGFWDKMRLIFHWSLVASFTGEVRVHVKGSRNPYEIINDGAGFVLSFQGHTKWLVGHKNKDSELIQIISDSMHIAIPDLRHLVANSQRATYAHHLPETSTPFQKVCAKLRSGVRFGIGFVLERACGVDCPNDCTGSAFQRKCRHFDFRPHYEVILEKKITVPTIKGPDDSYNLFRSDFIHLSLSLASSTDSSVLGTRHNQHSHPSSLHLTPKSFAHFWSWCALFDSVLSLPIRQGTYYPPRPISPKLGRHLATIKYRIHLHRLFITHAYMDESRETWVDGLVPWVGVKGMIDDFQVDMHQRDEESTVPGLLPDSSKVIRRKPLYAAEVVLKGLDLRAMLVRFQEPLRQAVQMSAPPQRSNYGAHQDLPPTDPSSLWHDSDDFVETDWSPSVEPVLHLLPVVSCPHFTYFKRNSSAPGNATEASKFGIEKSHTCLLGEEPSAPQIQIELASARIAEIRKSVRHQRTNSDKNTERARPENMITLLENYVNLLKEADNLTNGDNTSKPVENYLLPSYAVSPDEWAEFENVYQIHCPKVFMDTAIRDIMMQYYYCSRARRGLEYHLSTRAVKFIRDQAKAALATDDDSEEDLKTWGNTNTAQIAASALRRMLGGDQQKSSVEVSTNNGVLSPEDADPLSGWSTGVSLRKGHCCLLLKPQIVMRGEGPKDVCVVAAVQAKLQSFAIMDDSNAEDPISGKVMSRNYTSVSGLQTFSPAHSGALPTDGCVPFEVLIDLRCESQDFDQLVPQTDATFHYDKFNRLRLRNNITSAVRGSTERSDTSTSTDHHLQDQTDLIRVHIPRFTVSANDEHFQAISHIVTKLLLFSDVAHKTRLDKLETLLFTYDFTDLESAADVVAGLQGRLEAAIETQLMAQNTNHQRLQEEEGKIDLLKLKAHIFLLSEELNFIFDAIKLAQDRLDDQTDQKSALLLHASSSEISWRMLDDRRGLLSKLVVQDIDFYWLNRQDSSTVNDLSIGNLQAFDGSRHAVWAEILSKHDEPANHSLLKRGLFLVSSWIILAPVGGITIYESFELTFHPMRLQIDARVGSRIMEYLWPARRDRQNAIEDISNEGLELNIPPRLLPGGRTSLDSPRALHGVRHETGKELVPPVLRKLGSSRSFTDLRSTKDTLQPPTLNRTHSSETLRHQVKVDKRAGDAAEMKTRASQKSFVLVRISSLHIILSMVKEGSFECHDARISTRDLEYRNQTWSFEELVNQFIPSDTSWRGWVKMAFHQPLLPVLPVARELISKTKWIPSSSKAAPQLDIKGPPPKLPRARALSEDDDTKLEMASSKVSRAKSKSPSRTWLKKGRSKTETPLPSIMALPLSDEPESFDANTEGLTRSGGRKRMMSLFARRPSSSKGGSTSSSSTLLLPHKPAAGTDQHPIDQVRNSEG